MPKKSTGLRYDEKKLQAAFEYTGQKTAQGVFDYFVDAIWFEKHPPKKVQVISIQELHASNLKALSTASLPKKEQLSESIAAVAPSGLKFKNKPKKEEVPAKEAEAVELPKNDEFEERPKWELKRPVMKVPEKLTGIARQLWISEWKKNNL